MGYMGGEKDQIRSLYLSARLSEEDSSLRRLAMVSQP